MAEEKQGIKEFKEALYGALVLGLAGLRIFKDGAQLSDLADLWNLYQNDEDVKNAFTNAVEGYQKIPDELKDIDVAEMIEIVEVCLKIIPDYIAELKKKPS